MNDFNVYRLTGNRFGWTLLAAFVLTFIISGCGGIKNDYIEKKMFRLAPGPGTTDSTSREQGIPLMVKRLDISPEFSDDEFVYRIDQDQYTQDYYNQYMTSPGRMISDYVMEFLAASDQFAPIPKSHIPDNTCQIWGKVINLYCDRRDPAALSTVVTLRLNLGRQTDEGFEQVFGQTYTQTVPLTEFNPQAYIDGIGQALTKILNNFLSEVRDIPLE